jgi:hypothetical protein
MPQKDLLTDCAPVANRHICRVLMGAGTILVGAWVWQNTQFQQYFAKAEAVQVTQSKAIAELQIDVNYLIRIQVPPIPNRVAALPGALQDEAEQ